MRASQSRPPSPGSHSSGSQARSLRRPRGPRSPRGWAARTAWAARGTGSGPRPGAPRTARPGSPRWPPGPLRPAPCRARPRPPGLGAGSPAGRRPAPPRGACPDPGDAPQEERPRLGRAGDPHAGLLDLDVQVGDRPEVGVEHAPVLASSRLRAPLASDRTIAVEGRGTPQRILRDRPAERTSRPPCRRARCGSSARGGAVPGRPSRCPAQRLPRLAAGPSSSAAGSDRGREPEEAHGLAPGPRRAGVPCPRGRGALAGASPRTCPALDAIAHRRRVRRAAWGAGTGGAGGRVGVG
jgi:translation initiation factor IF-2